MKGTKLEQHWLQEKLIGYAITLIGFLLVCLGTVAVWVILEIKTEIKDLSKSVRQSNQATQDRIAKVEEVQMNGAVRIGEMLKSYESQIKFNTHRIEKLEERK